MNSYNIKSQNIISAQCLNSNNVIRLCVSSLQVSYTGTKSYNNTFHDAGSQSVSGQMVLLTGLTPDTNYKIVVIATNTAGFRNSSDAVVGATLTGRKLWFSTSPTSSSSFICFPPFFPSSFISTAPPPINEPPKTGTQVGGSLTITLTVAHASNLGGQIRSEQTIVQLFVC